MKNISFWDQNRIILAGDLNVFFDSKLETKGGKPSLKQKSEAKLLELKSYLRYKTIFCYKVAFDV